MSFNHTLNTLNEQRDKVKYGSPKLKIIAPCTVGNGILKLAPNARAFYEEQFHEISSSLCFFIPASGSGSRMFDFLQVQRKSDNPELAQKTKCFIDQLKYFAFYKNLSTAQKEKIASFHSEGELINFIINDEDNGINLGGLPKGLVPFHSYKEGQNSAFYEHLRQGIDLSERPVNFHFTIQNNHKELFESSLSNFKSRHHKEFEVGFSFQDSQTDAFVFDAHQKPIVSSKNVHLRRPSGHGALLENLNELKEQYILIKNIDNVQHSDQAQAGIHVWRMLCGILHHIKSELKALNDNPNHKRLKEISEEFSLFSSEDIEAAKDKEFFKKMINKPIRVCGMVLNEGKVGGGPFYVDLNGNKSKQIVEGVQVKGEEQKRVFDSSTHFNPVMMAMDTFDFEGRKFDLTKFSNDDQYFVVHKNYEGQPITFIERPGLWNGSMFLWNTIFIEIPAETFTPVKTILDLLKPEHQQNS